MKFQIGDRVKYSPEYLADEPPERSRRRGEVQKLLSAQVVSVLWDDAINCQSLHESFVDPVSK